MGRGGGHNQLCCLTKLKGTRGNRIIVRLLRKDVKAKSADADRLFGVVIKAPASRAADLGSIPALPLRLEITVPVGWALNTNN